ncbi:MAG: hypothetical protein LC114_18515 [Bryobacterales bacterium]|nr:hypothetical protein [Bryobacterales bacterium]
MTWTVSAKPRARAGPSAGEIGRQCEWEPGLQWLTGLQKVNHHTLNDYRVEHGEAVKQLFEQVLAVLLMTGLVTLERVTMHGTKARAHVNKKTFGKPAKLRAHQDRVPERLDQDETELSEDTVERLKRVAAEATWPALTYNLQRYFAITRAQARTA